MYAFENIWRSYKNDYDKLYQFLKAEVDPNYLVELFKENEIPTEVYLSIIETLDINFKE